MIVANERTQVTGENAAREFWLGVARAHPGIYGAIQIILGTLGYFVNFHFLVGFAQWLVRVAGRVAQSALLLATLWVTVNNVAHLFVTRLLDSYWIITFNQLSVIAFSLIPELILAAAIQASWEHWALFMRNRSAKNQAWVWGALYTIPTVFFVVITIYTLSGFVNAEAANGSAPVATGIALTVRLMVGWGYSLVDILYASIGKKGYVAMLDNLRDIATELRGVIDLRDGDIAALRHTIATHDERIATLSATHDERIATLSATHQQEIVALQARLTEKEEELQEAVRARQKALRPKALRSVALIGSASSESYSAMQMASVSATPQSRVHREGATEQNGHSATSATGDGYVAIDDGASIAISNGEGATVIATGEPRERIKIALSQALRSGEKINYMTIAQVAQAGYSTVRKHAPAIIEEIQQQRA